MRMYFFEIHASVVKLADALDSGSSGSDPMQVQVLSLAPCLVDKSIVHRKSPEKR